MPIEIPHEVALFLNLCGVPYPDINEDDVRRLGEHVREFAGNVQQTHESATGAVSDMGSVYSGYAYEQLISVWAHMSATHMADLDAACKVVAKALDIAADVITVVKVAVLAELAALALSYGAIIATPAGPATAPLLTAAARRICDQMQQNLIAYLIAEVIIKAIEPLEHTIDDMIKGVVYDAASNALGVPPPSSTANRPLHIEPDEVLRYSKLLDEHADDIMRHAENFRDQVAKLDFTTGSPDASYDSDGPQRDASDPPTTRTVFDPPSTTSGVDSPQPSPNTSTADQLATPDVRATSAGHEVTEKPDPGAGNSTKVADSQPPDAAEATASTPRAGLSNPLSSPTSDVADATAPGRTEGSALSQQISPRGDLADAPAAESTASASQSARQSEGAIETRESDPMTLGNRADFDSGSSAGIGPTASVPQAVEPTDQSVPATPWTATPRTPTPLPTSGKPAVGKQSRPAANRRAELEPTDRKPVTSPWSTTRPSVRPPKVTAPTTTRPTPWVRTDRKTESDRDTNEPETHSAETESNATTTPAPPAIDAPTPDARPHPST
ncbi:hypothetical protein ACQPXH_11035 [Nocardia sp. CA-135953]|uniref:WXG100-like domain-containing protein n=1 Tax=Nocardia sp. CA-135953 TaxID=3239978 RepID=UPI003D96F24F